MIVVKRRFNSWLYNLNQSINYYVIYPKYLLDNTGVVVLVYISETCDIII